MSYSGIVSLKYVLREIYTKINSFYRSKPQDKYFLKSLREIEKVLNILNSIEQEIETSKSDIIEGLIRKASMLRDSLSYLSKSPSTLYREVHKLTTYIRASYYDLTNKLGEVKRSYRMYITAFVISLILMPIFLGASILFIGILMFPLFISIHAFRARKKLGPLIASALIPIILFVCTNAVWYSLYAFSTGSEITELSKVVGSTFVAMIIILVLGILGILGIVLAIYSYIKLMKYLDAFI